MLSWALFLALGMSLGAISQGFGDVRSRTRQGIVGDWVYSDPTRRSRGGLNAYPQAVQITTVTVTDQGDGDDVVITINGIDVEYATGTGKDLATIGAELAEAINAEPLVRANVRASFDTATLTLTGLNPGISFTVSIASDPDSVLSAVTTTQAAATATAIPFGRAVVFNAYNPGNAGNALGETERLVMLPLAAAFDAQVITATVVNGVATARNIRVWQVRGEERIAVVDTVYTGNATEATEAAAIATAVNAAAPANTVLADDDGAAVTFTAEVPGTEIYVEIEQATAGDITFAETTGPNAETSLVRAWEGVSLYSRAQEAASLTSEEGQYAANAGVEYAVRGVVWVESDEAVTRGGTVYVETASGATCGRFYATSSATRVALPRQIARWERDGLVGTDSLAALRLEA
jgi:hypothetical protein